MYVERRGQNEQNWLKWFAGAINSDGGSSQDEQQQAWRVCSFEEPHQLTLPGTHTISYIIILLFLLTLVETIPQTPRDL